MHQFLLRQNQLINPPLLLPRDAKTENSSTMETSAPTSITLVILLLSVSHYFIFCAMQEMDSCIFIELSSVSPTKQLLQSNAANSTLVMDQLLVECAKFLMSAMPLRPHPSLRQSHRQSQAQSLRLNLHPSQPQRNQLLSHQTNRPRSILNPSQSSPWHLQYTMLLRSNQQKTGTPNLVQVTTRTLSRVKELIWMIWSYQISLLTQIQKYKEGSSERKWMSSATKS